MRFGVGVRFAGVPLPLVASRTSFAARITAPNSWHAVMSSSSSLRTKSSSLPAGKTSISGKAVSRSRSNLNFGSPPVTPGYFSDQTNNNFTIQWDAVPTQAAEDVFSGLSFGPATSPTGYACIVRFATTGNIDARNGGAYAASATVPYTANTSYRFRMVVRISNHTYDVYVTPQGQSEILLANNFAFRTENNTIATLDYLSKFITSGDATLTNMVGPSAMGLVPVVTGQTFSLTTTGGSFVAGEVVGTMSALYEPTSWAITAGNTQGNFAITPVLTGDFTANITVTSAGVTNLANQTGTATLTIRATNAFGTSANATATINYSGSASTFDIPLSFNDPMFTNMTTFGNYTFKNGDNINHVQFTGADNSIFLFDIPGTATLSYARVTSTVSNDGDVFVRNSIGGGTYNVDHVFFDNNLPTNPTGTHADGIQFQDIGADGRGATGTAPATFNLSHSMIIIGGLDVTAGMFVADQWWGTVNMTNVIWQVWTQYGTRIHSDTKGDNHISLNNVFYDVRGGSAALLQSFGGTHLVIDQWINVRYCTVNNGVLTLGAAIPQPTQAQLDAGIIF